MRHRDLHRSEITRRPPLSAAVFAALLLAGLILPGLHGWLAESSTSHRHDHAASVHAHAEHLTRVAQAERADHSDHAHDDHADHHDAAHSHATPPCREQPASEQLPPEHPAPHHDHDSSECALCLTYHMVQSGLHFTPEPGHVFFLASTETTRRASIDAPARHRPIRWTSPRGPPQI